MASGEFALWRQGAQDKHKATAVLTKQHDPQSDTPTIIRQVVVGDGAHDPASSYNETESGINISLEWKGDELLIGWEAGQTKRQVERVKMPFSERFRSKTQGEQAAPSDGDKPSN